MHRVGRDVLSALFSKSTVGAHSRPIRFVRCAYDFPLSSDFHSDDSFVPGRHHHSTDEPFVQSLPNTDAKGERDSDFIAVLGDCLARIENSALVMDMNNIAYTVK